MNLRRLVSIIATSAISLLASSHLVVAAEEVHEHQEVVRDYLEEIIRLMRERVQVATSSGPFEHGVPILNTWTDTALMGFLLAISEAGVRAGKLYHGFKKKIGTMIHYFLF